MTGKWKYKVRPRRNFYNGQFWSEWRIERSRTEHNLISTEPFCDVHGTRKLALLVAKTLNASKDLSVVSKYP